MMDGVLDYLGDNLMEFRGPVDNSEADPTSLGTITSDSVVCTGRLYDTANDAVTVDLVTKLTADEPATETEIAVEDITGFENLEPVEVELDTGLWHSANIVGAPAAGVITLSAGLATAASKYNRLRRVTTNTESTYIAVDTIGDWKIGDTLIAIRDDKTRQSVTVTQVLTSPCPLIVVGTAISSDLSAGQEIKNQLGGDIVMADFGTEPTPPVARSPLWGYRGTVDHDHGGLGPGMYVRAEMTVVDGTINGFRVAHATVKRGS